MASNGKMNDSAEQRRQEQKNRAAGSGKRVPGIDKKLNGPNRPAE